MEKHSTIAVANYFVGKAHEEGVGITPMKLLKLVYIAHGWALGLYDKPLIGEQVQAWQYGPVIESVYRNFKQYGRHPILRQQKDNPLSSTIPTVEDADTKDFLDSVWNAYKQFGGLQLSDLTHRAGTPWDVTWNENNGSSIKGAVIPETLIQEHYKELAEKRKQFLDSKNAN